jgi:hypothetical protein
VARRIWEEVADIIDLPVISDFESMAKWWIRGKKFNSVNLIYDAVLWALWKLRNNLCFQGQCWEGMRRVMLSYARLLQLDIGEQL